MPGFEPDGEIDIYAGRTGEMAEAEVLHQKGGLRTFTLVNWVYELGWIEQLNK